MDFTEFLSKNDTPHEIKISIVVPNFYLDEIKLNSRELMIRDILMDLSETDDALYINKFRVFLDSEKAVIKPTQERARIIKKLMNRYEQ